MLLAMTRQIAGPLIAPLVFETKNTERIGPNNRGVKINQMGIVHRVALGGTHAVRIVANTAGCVLITDVLIV